MQMFADPHEFAVGVADECWQERQANASAHSFEQQAAVVAAHDGLS